MFRILLVDDDRLIRVSVRCILTPERDMEIVGEATTGRDAVRMLKTLSPDMVILDVGLPDIRGVSVVRKMLAVCPMLKILVLTSFAQSELPAKLLEAGVLGFVTKQDAGPQYLVQVIKAVASGQRVLSPSIKSRLSLNRHKAVTAPAFSCLSDEEQSVALSILARFIQSHRATKRLDMDAVAFRRIRDKIFGKVCVNDKVSFIFWAMRCGIIEVLPELEVV